jgi:hypothetical protein
MEKKKEMLMELFKSNDGLFVSAIEELDSYNGYLGDARYYDMYLLDEFYHGSSAIELLNRAYFGRDDDNYYIDDTGRKHFDSFNPNREYFYYNGYGNLVSSDYKDYSCHLDGYFIDALLENYNHLYLDDEIKNIIEGE